MYHISANLAFGRSLKNIWGYKKLQGCQIGCKRAPKRSGALFVLLLIDIKFLWGAKKISGGAIW